MFDTLPPEVEIKADEAGVLPCPPIPDDLCKVDLSENSRKVLERRYLRRDKDGQPAETVEQMFWRVSYHIAAVEEAFQGDVIGSARSYYELMANKNFLPNSPTFTGAGTLLGQLAACFVLPVSDDMGRKGDGIFQTLRDAALVQQTGGGNGFSFSRLREKGSLVKSSSGQATGPVGFLRVYDKAFGEIAQGGTRRGANMAVLRVDHPDIRQFITCKSSEDEITNFNISVGITDAFMHAVAEGSTYDLISPQSGEVVERAEAREIFEMIVKYAHHNGEPGVLFLDAANRGNPLPHLYELEATNPCGEQWLGPYENCCLGSINLAQHFGPARTVDWEKLSKSIQLSTRFLDDVIDANAYVPAVPQLKQSAMRARRIGLGVMGLADLMYHVGVRYGSEEGIEFASQVIEFIRYHIMRTSIQLAVERGPFPSIAGSIYDPDNLTWEPPTPLHEYTMDFARPEIVWETVVDKLREHGIRNAAQTTIAPTGTISTVAGCEGYGCEPVFALAYVRHVNDDGQDLQLNYASPMFEQALVEAGIDDVRRMEIVEEVLAKGSCQDIELVPADVRDTFVVSQDINAEGHVMMQTALQRFVDNSISKTCNFPASATVEDVADAYQLAWENDCKGLTVYVTGSRDKVVLETAEAQQLKEDGTADESEQLHLWEENKKPRPTRLDGSTYQIRTPLGKTFVTINQTIQKQPFEIFITSAKAGSDTAAVSEAIGRLISYILRISSPVSPRDRMAEVIRQLAGIGGGRSVGFGPNRVLSLPDGLARSLSEYLGETEDALSDMGKEEFQFSMKIGDLCPECGQASLVNEEGCRKCYSCGYSEC
ncbi:MAG: adenosylcobalamin-dependent ribonucleoside-diphosphate reductase [Anaerolineales bacterium]|nr:adenosylcobalamin-dependent ribonucleoside-diphosphate reductase [Anaerolineales bacterium]